MKAVKINEPWKVAYVDIEKPVPKEGGTDPDRDCGNLRK